MNLAANIVIGLVALIHLYFLVLEMFLWSTPRGRKIFGTEQAFADEAKTLAGNQGLYNGILAAGLIWSLFAKDPVGHQVALYLLLSVIVAGLYGGFTVTKRILFFQALPAAVGLVPVLAAG